MITFSNVRFLLDIFTISTPVAERALKGKAGAEQLYRKSRRIAEDFMHRGVAPEGPGA
jgi:hypothetical protein